jgi:hypothetical protein
MVLTFSQSSPTQDVPLQKIILLSLGLLALLTIGLLVVQRVKKRLQSDDEDASDLAGGFTLSDLRRLHKTGEMSNEEFEKAKVRIIEAAKRAAERDSGAKKKAPPGETQEEL